MTPEDFEMHLRAGATYGRESTCGIKIDYASEQTASKAALAMTARQKKLGYERPLEAYPCTWCSGWHIGREMTEEERIRFS